MFFTQDARVQFVSLNLDPMSPTKDITLLLLHDDTLLEYNARCRIPCPVRDIWIGLLLDFCRYSTRLSMLQHHIATSPNHRIIT